MNEEQQDVLEIAEEIVDLHAVAELDGGDENQEESIAEGEIEELEEEAGDDEAEEDGSEDSKD